MSADLEREDDVATRADANAGGRLRLPVKLPGELRAFWVGSLIAFALAFVVGWLEWRAGMSRLRWDPLSDPLFGDLREYPGTYTLLHSAAFFNNVVGRPWQWPMYSPVAYPPFAAVVMAPLYAFPVPELLFVMVAVAWLAVCVGWVRGWLVRAGIGRATALLFPVSAAVVSFPIERLVHQGNVELVLWMFTAVGVWTFVRGYDDAAAVLWGLAAAMKLFPLVLLALLLPRGKRRAVAVGVGTFVGATVASLWWLGPTVGVAWHGSLHNVFGYQSVRVAEWSMRELVANHSVFELAKLAAMFVGLPLAKLTLPYYALGAVGFGAAFFGKLWKMPAANQVLGVSTFMVMFPPISYYHALVHLYAPLAMLGWVAIRAQRAGERVAGLGPTMLLFVPLFAPFTLMTFQSAVLYCGLVQACVLVGLFVCALRYPFAASGWCIRSTGGGVPPPPL